jgi:hypothetical protein
MVKKWSRRRKIWVIVLGSLLVILIAFRIALPYILLRFVNKELQTIPGYTGHVDDIDVALIRGAYTIKTIKLDKTGGKIPVPFFSAEKIDLSVEWAAIFHRRLVGKLIVIHPIINFAKGPNEATSQTEIKTQSWTKVVGDLMPLKINRFEIFKGEVHYRDFYSEPKVNIFAADIHILAENLSNAKRQPEELPSTVEATAAGVYGGHADLHMKLNALDSVPTFEVKAELLDMDITKLNDFLSAYGKFDVRKGTISIYTEAAAKDGKIKGYTKPIIKDLRVVNWEKDKPHPLKLAWEALIGAVNWVVKNKGKDQLATRADFEGELKDPDISTWYIIGQMLRNGFIQALYPELENSINIKSVDEVKGGKDEMKGGTKKETRKERRKEKKKKKEEEKKKDAAAAWGRRGGAGTDSARIENGQCVGGKMG